jgi:hypothetical protein
MKYFRRIVVAVGRATRDFFIYFACLYVVLRVIHFRALLF